MPIYEYLCQDCGNRFEALVASDSSEVACRNCQSRRLEKQFSTFAVAGGSSDTAFDAESGPCGTCGAAKQGMCQMMN